VQSGTIFEHFIVLAQFRQEIVQWLDGTSTEYFIENTDFRQELPCDLLETAWQFCYVCECYFKVVSQVRELVNFEA